MSNLNNSVMRVRYDVEGLLKSTSNVKFLRDLTMSLLVVWLESPYQNFMSFTVFGMLWAIWFFLAFASNSQAFAFMIQSKRSLAVYFWPFVYLMVVLAGKDTFSYVVFLYPFISLCGIYYIETRSFNSIKAFISIYFVYLFMIYLGSIMALVENPMISRILADSNKEVTKEFATPFVANFSTVNNTSLLLPVFIYLLLKKNLSGNKRFFAWLLVILGVAVMLMAQYFLAVVVSACLLSFLFLFDSMNRTKAIILLLLYLITIGVVVFFEPLVLCLAAVFKSEVYANRLLEIAKAVTEFKVSETTDLAIRVNKYLLSLKTFIENPLFGVGAISSKARGLVGGHSQYFDALACYGLFVGSLFIYIVPCLYRCYEWYFEKKYHYVLKCVFISYFIDNTINLCYTPEMLFFIAFVIPMYLLLVQDFEGVHVYGENITYNASRQIYS